MNPSVKHRSFFVTADGRQSTENDGLIRIIRGFEQFRKCFPYIDYRGVLSLDRGMSFIPAVLFCSRYARSLLLKISAVNIAVEVNLQSILVAICVLNISPVKLIASYGSLKNDSCA